MIIFGVWDCHYYYFPEEEWPQLCQGKEILSPLLPSTRSLPPLFQLSLLVPWISCGVLQCEQSEMHPLSAPGVGLCLSLQQGTSPERCWPGRCAWGRASGQDKQDQIAEEHSQGKATKTPLQKYLGKAAEQTLSRNPGVTVQQKPHISFMNYLTVCLRARKYTPNPPQTTKDAESTELQGAEENP